MKQPVFHGKYISGRFFSRWKIFASTSQEIQKHLTRQLREEKQEASSWVQGGAKWGERTALKEVITPVSPL